MLSTPKVALNTDDIRNLVQTIFTTPYKHGPTVSIGSKDMSLIDFGRVNSLVIERMFAQIAVQAVKGDIKSAELLLKYSGLKPPEEQHIVIDKPTIINNVPLDETVVVETVDPPVEDDVPDE